MVGRSKGLKSGRGLGIEKRGPQDPPLNTKDGAPGKEWPTHSKTNGAAGLFLARVGHSYSCFPQRAGREPSGGWFGFAFLFPDCCSKLMRCRVEEGAAPLGLLDFWLGDGLPPPTLRLRSGQAQWANFCRASGALE